MNRHCFALIPVLLFGGLLSAAGPDLSEYRTVDKAIAVTSAPVKAGQPAAPRPGFLGLHVAPGPNKRLVVAEVAADSPAAKAGAQRGDEVVTLNGAELTVEDAFYDALRAKPAGEAVKLALARQGKPLELTATLAPISRPMAPGSRQGVLGVTVATVKDGEGVAIEQVTPGSAAERAKLKPGEVILKVDDADVTNASTLGKAVAGKRPDDPVTLTLMLAEKRVKMEVRLGSDAGDDRGPRGGRGPGGAGGWDARARYWSKPVYRVAIIGVEYPDVKHNEKITPRAWEESMFSTGRTYKQSATGQTAHGSMNDYYQEQSYGLLKVEGKMFDYVEVSKKRADYATGNRQALLTESMDKILARDGKDAFKDVDGVFFIYAGDRMNVARGSLYWPHRSNVNHNGKSWPYFICNEGGQRMGNISVFAHEFGHMLGLPDLYARPETPGMEGVGIWCAMANQAGNGKPQHFCAWSKERLGWVKPTTIDPAVKQKLVLSPIEDDPKQCFKVLAKPDGSEYFLLEYRKKKGFDESLPAEGLLIWRVIGNRPVLEESHGVAGAAGPRSYPNAVPFPSAANDAFTPFTTPSSRAQLGGGAPVYITNIRKLDDGRIAFHVGYEYQ